MNTTGSNESGEAKLLLVGKPTFDLSFTMAVALVYQRYFTRLARRFDEGYVGTPFEKVVVKHVIRLQRLSESIAAAVTTGAVPEASWHLRSSIELFTSQALLQFGPVLQNKRKASESMRLQMYFDHETVVELTMRESYYDAPELTLSNEEKIRILRALDARLQGRKRPSAKSPWHLRAPLQAAFDLACKSAESAASFPEKFREINWAFHIDQMHYGLHGAPSSAPFLESTADPGFALLTDNRTTADVNPAHAAAFLAATSLKLLAHRCGEIVLIDQMIDAAWDAVQAMGLGHVAPFPTTTLRDHFPEIKW